MHEGSVPNFINYEGGWPGKCTLNKDYRDVISLPDLRSLLVSEPFPPKTCHV